MQVLFDIIHMLGNPGHLLNLLFLFRGETPSICIGCSSQSSTMIAQRTLRGRLAFSLEARRTSTGFLEPWKRAVGSQPSVKGALSPVSVGRTPAGILT